MPKAALAILLLATALAGCGDGPTTIVTTETLPPVSAGKGAIAGIVIDDRYRPVVAATVLLTPVGLTALSDTQGQFAFTNLEPGAYVAVANADGHEAAPLNIDVGPNQYTEVEVQARRIFSDAGAIITTQYSVFIPCAFDYVFNGLIVSCVPDSSGDTYRPGFTADTRDLGANVTYLVTEAKMNQVGDYDLQVREDNGQSAGGERYAVGYIRDTDYKKMVNQYGVKNEVDNGQNNNKPWNNTRPYVTLVFMSGEHRETFGPVSNTTCTPAVDDANRAAGSPVRTCNWRGVGARFGIKATFVQSLFVGEPEVDIATYATLG